MFNQSPGHLPPLETSLWLVGLSLIVLYGGHLAWGEWSRERGVAAFMDARQSIDLLPLTRGADVRVLLPATVTTAARPTPGVILAVLRIPAIRLEVPVSYGTSVQTLRGGAGLIEGTAVPGSRGNVAIAAHRDTFFRGLQELVPGDRIELASADHTLSYRITGLTVVEPTAVDVLADTGEPVLTLVTCYPFHYIGSAPQRFIVRAVPDAISI